MQNPGASSQISNNGITIPNNSIYCSTSTLSDTGSWDTDFDDDQNSESSGFYGDVAPTIAEKPVQEMQTKISGVGRVAALAKTVAASLAASGHSGSSKFHKSTKRSETTAYQVNSADLPGHHALQKPADWPALKPLPKHSSHRSITNSLLPVPGQQNSFRTDKSKEKHSITTSSNSTLANATSGLPKPPGPESEQVQQVIGALGHMWSSDSISLSSQTQSDDDYEPMQSDSSPQMPRLSPMLNGSQNEGLNGTHHTYANDKLNFIPDAHSSPVQSFLHSATRTSEHLSGVNSGSTHSKTSPQSASQSTHFLHSSAAAAALASVASSAAARRLSQCSKRSSGGDSVYSPSSGSSISESSHHTALQSQQNVDGVYEPIEEKQKIQNHSQKSFLHSMQNMEKCDMKRPISTVKPHSDQRPPVPNRPLPPTPRPAPEKPSLVETARGGLLAANLDHHPWFHNVDRKQAEELIKNGIDGYFLIRPSSQSQNPLTLTLWYNQRVYNISVRQRKDGRVALGFEKLDEQSFSSIEEMVLNYQSENLLLFSRNERTGRTVLTKSPPKPSH